MTDHFKPGTMLELGTSFGFSAMYQAAGNPDGKLYTIEGCRNTMKQAQENIRSIGISNIRCLHGNFDEQLSRFLADHDHPDWSYIDGNHTYEATIRYFEILESDHRPDSVIVLDDIHWSREMTDAWNQIIQFPSVTMSLDLFHIGVVFFDPAFSKQNFRIRFY